MATEEPIVASEVRFRSLFENSPELILYQNEAGLILDANPAFLALVGETKAQVLHRPYTDFLSPEAQPLFEEKRRQAFLGRTVRFDMYTTQGPSAPRHWDVVKVPLWEHGRVVGVHMLARDITEKRLAQDEIFAQNQNLQQFAYLVSHHLRAPLANALGLVDVLGSEAPTAPSFAEVHAHLQHSLQELDRVLRDVNTILAVRDQQGLTTPAPVALAEVVQEVLRTLHPMLEQCGGTLHLEVAAGLRVRANRAYLYAIFFNLLANAIKYRASHRPLHVTLAATADPAAGATIVVADNGLGFDQDQVGAEVFGLYKRFHPQYSGRGLGLYLVKTYVESLGGHIAVSSRVDEGTRFTIQLPY